MDEEIPTAPTSCVNAGWEFDSDDGNIEWEESPTPDDIDTALTSDECVLDTIGAIIIRDAVSGCIRGATAGVATGAHPLIYIDKRIHFRHLTPGEKRRLKKALNPH